MENKFQTSFIPKTSLTDGSVKSKSPISLLYVISVVAILVTLAASGTLFGFKYITEKNIESKRIDLVNKEKTFDYESMNEVVRIDKKIKAAGGLIKNHTAVSNLFSLIEENTLRNLRFTSFDFGYLDKDKIVVTMKGEALNFGVVAKQAEVFASLSGEGSFKDAVFSDVNVVANGNVAFSLLTSVNPSVISYSNNLPATASSVVVPAPTPATSTASTTKINNTQQ